MAVHGVGSFLQGGKRHNIVELDFLRVGTSDGIHDAKTDGNACQAAAGTVLVKCDFFLAHITVRV